jgi:oligoribonuclease
MTGLDTLNDTIIEIACIITDKDLNIVQKSKNLVIHKPTETMDKMGEWCTQHHKNSGLSDQVLKSTITTSQAEQEILSLIKSHIPIAKSAQLAGNSVHMDKVFLQREMPKIIEYLHYRIVDVSTIKELARRWYLAEYKNIPKKKEMHRALDDIEESIAELKYYKNCLFK